MNSYIYLDREKIIKHFLKNKDSAILPNRAILLEHLTQTYLFFHKLKFLT
jgi:hypothetical protein